MPTNLFDELSLAMSHSRRSIRLREGERTVSGLEFEELIDDYRRRISTSSSPGDRIGVPQEMKINALAYAYACFATGRTAVFLPEDATYQEHVLRDANVRLIPEHGAEAQAVHDTQTCHPALIIYTSGTTASLRKGVLVSHDSVSNCSAFMNNELEVSSQVREILVAPIDHLYGFGRCHSVLTAGGELLLSGRRSSLGAVLAAIGNGFNSLGLVPSVLTNLLQHAEPQLKKTGHTIRWIQTGAMRLDQHFRRQMLDLFPNARIGLHYGLTEVMRATFLALHAEPHKMHTEGRPRPGVSIEIRDDENRPLPRGTEGNICISGDALASGYTRADEWAKRLTLDGWYMTGDIGMLDSDGYLVFRGRSDDVINVNGNLVHPMEVDSRLSTLIDKPFCVVGVRDPRGHRDMVLAVCIEGESDITVETVAKHMAGAARHLIPSYVFKAPELPRTVTGKIKRAEAADFVFAALSATRP